MHPIKPILFNTEMVRAILSDQKTTTRRIVKYRSEEGIVAVPPTAQYIGIKVGRHTWEDGNNMYSVKAPYNIGDVLWVREAFMRMPNYAQGKYAPNTRPIDDWTYYYRADEKTLNPDDKWRPSIHMPFEAARLFLQVTDVWGERLLDITDTEARKEGLCDTGKNDCSGTLKGEFADLWNSIYAEPQAVYKKGPDGKPYIAYYVSYPFSDTQEICTYKGKPLHVCGNPHLWVIEYKHISKEAAYST